MEQEKETKSTLRFDSNLNTSAGQQSFDSACIERMKSFPEERTDNIIVQSTGFPLEEIKYTGSINLEIPNYTSIPRLNLEENNKSSESNPSLGTVLQFDSPNLSNRKKLKPKRPVQTRPNSAKSHRSKSGNHSSRSTKKRNNEVRNMFAAFSTKRNPSAMLNNKRNHKEIQKFFESKNSEYQMAFDKALVPRKLTPYQISKREKLRVLNREKAKKSEEIFRKKEADELLKFKESMKLFKENCEFRIKNMTEKKVKELEKKKQLEDSKILKEKKVEENQEKNIIMDNIKNFYQDKMKILKEQLEEEQLAKKVIQYEEKQLLSEAEKFKREKRKKHINEAKANLQLQQQQIQLNFEAKHQIENQIISLYKKSKLPK